MSDQNVHQIASRFRRDLRGDLESTEMTDVDTLFSEYREAHRSGGEADPSSFLSRVEGTDRAELAALIDAYLARSPGRAWDAAAFAGSPAERVTDRVASEWDEWELAPEVAGWQELLPALRNKASLKRREVVERLAEGLGVRAQTEKVAAYYHEMETGALPAGRRLEQGARRAREHPRRDARAAPSRRARRSAETSTRTSACRSPGRRWQIKSSPTPTCRPHPPRQEPRGSRVDRVDELFTGGPDAGV